MTETNKWLNHKCRTCFNPENGWSPLTKRMKDYTKEIKSYGQLLEEVTQIKILDNKYLELPHFICGKCSRRLKSAHRFKLQASEVNDKLYGMLKEECLQEIQNEVEEESSIEFEIDNKIQEAEEKIERLQDIEINIERWPGIKFGNSELDLDEESSLEIKDENVVIFNDTSNLDENTDTDLPNLEETNQNHNNLDHDPEFWPTDISDWEEDQVANKLEIANHEKISLENEENCEIATVCRQCNKIFPNSKALALHLKISHVPEEKKCSCPLCGNKYSRMANMYMHMRTAHGPDTVPIAKRNIPESEYIFQCDKCPKKYCRKFNLVQHKKLKHAKGNDTKDGQEVKYVKEKSLDPGSLCPICGKYLAIKANLTAHLRFHANEKPFKCEWCGRCFLLNTQLNRHRRQHTGDKPHKCELCGKCFAAPKDLRQHMVSHSDERPFKCSMCERCYKSNSDLKKHFRTHSIERPYVCSICGDSFQRASSLRTHRLRHERRKEAEK